MYVHKSFCGFQFNIYTVYIINFEQIEFFANLRNCEAIKETIKILYFNIVSYLCKIHTAYGEL